MTQSNNMTESNNVTGENNKVTGENNKDTKKIKSEELEQVTGGIEPAESECEFSDENNDKKEKDIMCLYAFPKYYKKEHSYH